jgi:hypothetical protein
MSFTGNRISNFLASNMKHSRGRQTGKKVATAEVILPRGALVR